MRLFFVICIYLFSIAGLSAQEQIKQGVYSISGSIYYSSTSINASSNQNEIVQSSQSIYAIEPSISYFILDHCELSLGVNYARSSIKYGSMENKSIDLAIDPGIRLYIPCGKIAPFIGIGGHILWTTPYSGSETTFSPPRTGYSFTGGLEIFIAPSVAIEPAIVYSRIRYDEQTSSNTVLVGIGVKYFIL